MTKFKVVFKFTRINAFENRVESERFYVIYAESSSEAETKARALFVENEPSAADVFVSVEPA